MSFKRYVHVLLIACVMMTVYLPSFIQAGDTGHIARNTAFPGCHSKILQTLPRVHLLITSQPDGEGLYGTKDNGTPRAADLDGVTKADHDCEASGTSKVFYTYHLDHLGSVRLITDEEGEVVWPADFETNGPARSTPFGEQYRPSTRSYDGTVLTSLRFTSKEFDAESQLSDFGARFLEHEYPARFVTQDPSLSSVFDLTNPQTFNLYTYCLNNPINLIDPFGLEPYDGEEWDGDWEAWYNDPSTTQQDKIANTGMEKGYGLDAMSVAVAFFAVKAGLISGVSMVGELVVDFVINEVFNQASTGDNNAPSSGLDDLFENGRTPKASELKDFAEQQGWKPSQSENGPLKYTDENGINRMTIKGGSSRAPGSANPHVELRDSSGRRVDPMGNPVTRKSPGNHTTINYDL